MLCERRRFIIILTADKHHSTRWRPEIGFVDAMTGFFFADHRTDVDSQILVAGILAQQAAQIMIFLAEQAGAQFSVGGQPNARAVSAERLTDRSDQADFAGRAVRETILPRGLA